MLECGKYGHCKEACPLNKKALEATLHAPVAQDVRRDGKVEENTNMDGKGIFGPWMIAQRSNRRGSGRKVVGAVEIDAQKVAGAARDSEQFPNSQDSGRARIKDVVVARLRLEGVYIVKSQDLGNRFFSLAALEDGGEDLMETAVLQEEPVTGNVNIEEDLDMGNPVEDHLGAQPEILIKGMPVEGHVVAQPKIGSHKGDIRRGGSGPNPSKMAQNTLRVGSLGS